jgi:hypothetical protein
MMRTMRFLRAEDEVVERKREQRLDLGDAPARHRAWRRARGGRGAGGGRFVEHRDAR